MSVNEVVNRLILCRLVIFGCLSIQGLVVSKLCEMLCGELMVLLTTQLAAMPRTLNLPQSCSHVGDRLQPGGVLTGGQDQLGAPVQQEGGQQSQQPSFAPGQGFSGQNDSGHGVSFRLPPGWDQSLPTVGADGLPFSGPSRSPPPVDSFVDWFDESTTAIGTSNDGGFETTATTATSATSPATTTTSWCSRP